MCNPGGFTQGNTRGHGLDQTAMLSGKRRVQRTAGGLHELADLHERTSVARPPGRPWQRRRHA